MLGDHKEAKSVFDMDSSQLLEAVRILESGKDLGGNELDGGVSFCAGAIVTPEADPLEPQLIKFEKKIDAGAVTAGKVKKTSFFPICLPFIHS